MKGCEGTLAHNLITGEGSALEEGLEHLTLKLFLFLTLQVSVAHPAELRAESRFSGPCEVENGSQYLALSIAAFNKIAHNHAPKEVPYTVWLKQIHLKAIVLRVKIWESLR
eukprot:1160177-Pelagomonas_calceolata.AAC.4